jgi:hypothetical protein
MAFPFCGLLGESTLPRPVNPETVHRPEISEVLYMNALEVPVDDDEVAGSAEPWLAAEKGDLRRGIPEFVR